MEKLIFISWILIVSGVFLPKIIAAILIATGTIEKCAISAELCWIFAVISLIITAIFKDRIKKAIKNSLK